MWGYYVFPQCLDNFIVSESTLQLFRFLGHHLRIEFHPPFASVRPDCSVVVVAPIGKDLEKVLPRVYHRRKWIAKQRAYFEQFRQLPKNKHYISGETHLYLGRQYRLKVRKNVKPSMKLIGHYMHVEVPIPQDINSIRILLRPGTIHIAF